MNSDIRINVTWLCNIKRKALIRRLGHKGAIALIDLWLYAAQNRPTGDLTGMSDEEIADAAQWDGDPVEFVIALSPKAKGIGFLDGTPGNYELHDWEEHNAFAYHAAERSEAARVKAAKRWQCHSNATAKLQQCKRDAPNPNPNPNPNPSPTPKPKNKIPVAKAPEPKPNFVKLCTDIFRELLDDTYKPTKFDIGQMKYAFEHVETLEELETRVRNWLDDNWVVSNNPGWAHFYKNIEKYKGEEPIDDHPGQAWIIG